MAQNQAFIVDVPKVVSDRHQTEFLADLQVDPGSFAGPTFFTLYNDLLVSQIRPHALRGRGISQFAERVHLCRVAGDPTWQVTPRQKKIK